MATIKDVARRAGVSTMTVSRVINNSGYISQETRERVEQAISALDYLPNALARSLRFKQTKTIALVLTDISNPFFTTVARGVEDAAIAQGFSVLFCNTDEAEETERAYLSVLIQKQVDGVLLVPASRGSAAADLLRTHGLPLVLIDRRLAVEATDVVRGDAEDGGYTLTRHLIDLGHRRIAAVSGPGHVSTAADRLAGYRRALREAGIPLDERLVAIDELSTAGGHRATARLLASAWPFTAVFGGNNFIAFGAYRALHEAGLRVPADVSLVTFDDLPTSWLMMPFLTTIDQPAYAIGRRATELLLDRLAERAAASACEVILPGELIIRQSSAPPAALTTAPQ